MRIVLAIFFLLIGDALQARERLSPDAFLRHYLAALNEAAPNWKIVIKGRLELEVNPQSSELKTIKIALDNAYEKYVAEPAELDEIMKTYVRGNVEAVRLSTLPPSQNMIVPTIRNCTFVRQMQAYLKDLSKGRKAPAPKLFVDELVADVCILFAFDRTHTLTYLTSDNTGSIGVSPGDLKSIASKNISKRLAEVEIAVREEFFVVTLNGGHGASLLLIDEFWDSSKMPIKGSFLVFAPSKDVLIVTGSESNLRRLTAKESSKFADISSSRVTSFGLVREGTSWKKWSGK